MDEEIKIPDITPSIPPEVEPEYKPLVGYISWGNDLRRWRQSLIDAMTGLLYIPIVGWMLYGIMYVLMFTVFELIVLLADLIDGLWNSIADIINYIYIWWINFKKTVEVRYQGNWWKAVVELTIKVLLLWALDQALNIPAVKQLWDTFVTTIRRINDFLMRLRNSIQDVFTRLSSAITGYFKNIDPLVRYIFREEIQFWQTQINSLISGVETRLMNMISRVDKVLTEKFEILIREVERGLQEIRNLKREIEKRAVDAIVERVATSIVISGEGEPWLEKREGSSSIDINFRYSMPGQVESTYKKTITLSNYLFSPQVMLRTLINELFDDKTDRGKRFNEIMKLASDGFDELFSSKDTWIPLDSILYEFKKEYEAAQKEVVDAEKKGRLE